MTRKIADWIRQSGPLAYFNTILIVSIVVVAVIYIKVPAEVGLPVPEEHVVVPASGTAGFKTDIFCNDDNTKVYAWPLPDVGIGYELVRKTNGIVERVAWIDGAPSGRYFGEIEQTAFINDEAIKCIKSKVQ